MFPACNGKQEAGEVDFAKCTPLKLTLLTQGFELPGPKCSGKGFAPSPFLFPRYVYDVRFVAEVLWSVRADQLRIPQPSRLRLVMFFAPGANSASGMSVSNDCKQKFMELKRKRTYRYIIFKIDEKLQQITLEKTGAPGASYEDY
ncbi:unnamed protein product [Sphagnum tenellum]